METFLIKKYNNMDINLIKINKFNIQYNFNDFFIQSPIFIDYEISNINSNKYLELKSISKGLEV